MEKTEDEEDTETYLHWQMSRGFVSSILCIKSRGSIVLISTYFGSTEIMYGC